MDNKTLHIVFLDNPYPPDYGGAIDMFFKAKAIKELGYKLTLHVFEYGRPANKELESLGEVFYYKRKKSVFSFFSFLPFIVKTRRSKELLQRLKSDSNPVLFEGLHTCRHLSKLKEKQTIVRTHNIEHDYYKELSSNASFFKRMYYLSEAKKLKRFEKKLKRASYLWVISEKDYAHFKKINPSCFILPPCFEIESQVEKCPTKPYVLFHGNLSVEENKAAIYKIMDACFDLDYTVVIAGKNPDAELEQELSKFPNFELHANPTSIELKKLINQSQVQLLITGQATGAKLKLIIGLCGNGQVVANDKILEGTTLSSYCIPIDDSSNMNEVILNAFRNSLSEEAHHKRIAYLKNYYNIQKNVESLLNLLNK